MLKIARFKGGRISRALLALPLSWAWARVALAGGAGSILPLPPWQLKADGKQANRRAAW
jgi:hypothetical protein